MFPRPTRRARLAFVLASCFVLGTPAAASAAGERDAEVMKQHDLALDEEYLAVEFDKAERRLKNALKRCGKGNACSPHVVGKLHIALGTVHGGGGKLDEARKEFVLALRADPNAALIDALTTPELAKAFREAQQEVARSGRPSGAGATSGAGGAAGDISHTPVSEQAVNTPVPVYVEVPAELEAAKATLRYKPFGAPKWKSVDMEPMAQGFGVEIPCEDVTTTGDIQYYIIVKDGAGDPVGTAGSLKAPHRVPIKHTVEQEPSLPGQEPPARCAAKEDCPPGLPGCPEDDGERGDKDVGESCEETVECQSGLVCQNGTCEEGPDDDEGADSAGNRNVLGLWGQIDVLWLRSKDSVCSGNDAAYACFYEGTSRQFYGEPANVSRTNGIEGGFGFAGARVMLSYDRQVFAKVPLLAGVRAGFAFGGSPSPEGSPTTWKEGPPGTSSSGDPPPQNTAKRFLPLHAELRATLFFGGDRMVEEGGFRPYLFLSPIGFAQVNGAVQVSVCDRRDENGYRQGGNGTLACPAGTREVKNLDAYQITGLNFSAAGAGMTYGLTSHVGVAAEVKVMLMWPTLGIVVAPTLGPVFSF